jgi:hypothetical protein
MAFGKHHRRRHHRRHYRGFVTIPGLSGTPLGWSAKGSDLAVGAAVGFGGSAALKMGLAKVMPAGVPDFVQKFWPVIGSGLAGAVAYFAQKKSHKSRAEAHLLGALLAGAAVSAWDALSSALPNSFSDVVQLRLGARRGYRGFGVPVNEVTPAIGPGAYAGYRGVIVNEPSRALSDWNLGQLQAASMDPDDDGINTLMDLD